jgi:hypothetical protein
MAKDVASAKSDSAALKTKQDNVNKRLGDLIVAAFPTYKNGNKNQPKAVGGGGRGGAAGRRGNGNQS